MELLTRLMTDLWYMDVCFLVVLLYRLVSLRFYERYPALVAYFVVDLVTDVVGLGYGTRPLVYYWTYFVCEILLGSVLLIWMCREMFAELYGYHPGLRGLTQCTLRRSILIGAVVTVGLAPVSIIHWGEADFQCWQFPFWEVHRCLTFGVVVFVVAMWRRLRLIPLDVPRNVKTYTRSMCVYLTCGGVVETVVLIVHTQRATLVWSVVIVATNLFFYGLLGVLAERPAEIRQVERLPIDPQEVAWLSSISCLLARVDEAQRRGRAATLRRLPFFAIVRSLYSAGKACARAGGVILGSAQKE